ncbi:UreF-domain-containing protein [Biscogniauxia sp. FL1348]|nr:UreF-domain-containing protein [Biscogniauxia sp. FL1348]
MNPVTDEGSQQELENEIAALESRLAEAKQRLREKSNAASSAHHELPPPNPPRAPITTDAAHHYLLLLSDSALPLGSFAFSSGLESYLAHGRHQRSTSSPPSPSFASFLPLSLSSYARTALPFVLAAHRDPRPAALAALDDALDATMICTVGRRASVAQGRALLSIWEKSLAPSSPSSAALAPFAALLRSTNTNTNPNPAPNPNTTTSSENPDEPEPEPAPVSAHLPPLFGAVAALLGLTARQAAYVFLLSHAKALVSAAVRAGCFGPYRAQGLLAGPAVRDAVGDAVAREWDTAVEDAGQRVPVMDLWVGRHELLYSRIFNS